MLALALSNVFTPEVFTINQVGGCRIYAQMAKQIVQQVAISGSISPPLDETLIRLRR